MKIRPLAALIWKDVKIHFSDPRAMIMTLAVPIVISSFFGFVMGGASGQPQRNKVACRVVNLDTNSLTTSIVSSLETNENIAVLQVDEAQARREVLDGKVPVAIVFPNGFGEQAARGFFGGREIKPELVILHDPSHSMELEMAKGILMQVVMQAVSKSIFTGESGRKFAREQVEQIDSLDLPSGDREALRSLMTSVEKWLSRTSSSTNSPVSAGMSGGMTVPFTTKTEALMKRQGATYNGYAQAFAGMTLQFVLMSSIEAGIAILLERQRGIWRRLRAAPVSRLSLLAARALSSATIAFLTLSICWSFSMLVFHVRVNGSWLGFIACNAAIAIFAGSLGVFISAVGKTPEASRGVAIFAVLVLIMLGGAWMPSFLFPAWLQKVTLILPTRWAVDGLAAMTWRGLDIGAALRAVGVLLAYALVLGGLALKLFRWELD